MAENLDPAERTSQTTGTERRARVRYSCDVESVCQPYSQNEDELWWPAQIRNVSAGGFGLLLNRRFEPGAVLSLEWSRGTEGSSRQLLVRVRHATHGPDQGWILGCEFLAPLSDEELTALL